MLLDFRAETELVESVKVCLAKHTFSEIERSRAAQPGWTLVTASDVQDGGKQEPAFSKFDQAPPTMPSWGRVWYGGALCCWFSGGDTEDGFGNRLNANRFLFHVPTQA